MRWSRLVIPFVLMAVLEAPSSAQSHGIALDTEFGPQVWFNYFEGPFVNEASLQYRGVWELSRAGWVMLKPSGSLARVVADAGELALASDARRLYYVVDFDKNDVDQGLFSWHEHSLADADRLMQLNANNGGDLFLGGTLTQNTSFDLAEAFWATGPVEAGDLVAVDPSRGDAIRRASESYQPALVGVVSERPGIVLGGSAFSVEALREAWGEEVVEAFERERPELEARVLAASEGLREEAARVASPAAFADFLRNRREEPETGEASASPASRRVSARARELTPEVLGEELRQAQASFESALFDETIRVFFAERFAAVALAGRVPVNVDASFGAIRAGDPLTSSPVPGVAMRATAPGPIVGMALEPLAEGSGRVLVLVQRGWYGGEGAELAGGRAEREVMESRLAAREREIEELRSRLAALESRLAAEPAGVGAAAVAAPMR